MGKDNTMELTMNLMKPVDGNEIPAVGSVQESPERPKGALCERKD